MSVTEEKQSVSDVPESDSANNKCDVQDLSGKTDDVSSVTEEDGSVPENVVIESNLSEKKQEIKCDVPENKDKPAVVTDSENNNKTDLNLEKKQEIECDVPENEDKPAVSESENNNKTDLNLSEKKQEIKCDVPKNETNLLL